MGVPRICYYDKSLSAISIRLGFHPRSAVSRRPHLMLHRLASVLHPSGARTSVCAPPWAALGGCRQGVGGFAPSVPARCRLTAAGLCPLARQMACPRIPRPRWGQSGFSSLSRYAHPPLPPDPRPLPAGEIQTSLNLHFSSVIDTKLPESVFSLIWPLIQMKITDSIYTAISEIAE